MQIVVTFSRQATSDLLNIRRLWLPVVSTVASHQLYKILLISFIWLPVPGNTERDMSWLFHSGHNVRAMEHIARPPTATRWQSAPLHTTLINTYSRWRTTFAHVVVAHGKFSSLSAMTGSGPSRYQYLLLWVKIHNKKKEKELDRFSHEFNGTWVVKVHHFRDFHTV